MLAAEPKRWIRLTAPVAVWERFNTKLGVFVRAIQHRNIGKFFEYEIKGVLGTAVGAVGKQNLVFLSDIAHEQVTRDANLADLAKLPDSLNHEGLPYRKNYGASANYKVSSPMSIHDV